MTSRGRTARGLGLAGAVLLILAHAHHPLVIGMAALRPSFGGFRPASFLINLLTDGVLFAVAGAVMLGWWAAGRRIGRWLRSRAPGGEGFALAAGLLAGSTVLAGLGYAGLLHRSILGLLLVGVVGEAARQRLWHAPVAWARSVSWATGWPVLCLLPALPWVLAAPLQPVTDVDLLEYHWGLPVLWALGHRIHHEAGNLLMTMPLGFEMLALPWAAFNLPGAVVCSQVIVLGVAAGAVAAATDSPLAGWLVAGLGAALALAGEGHPDTGLVLAAALAVLATRRGHPREVGLVLGLAAVTKYQGVALAGMLALGAAPWGGGPRRLGRWVVVVGGVALVPCAPWLARNFLWTGNPVYPFAAHLFPSLGWEDWNMATLLRSMPWASVEVSATWPDQRAAELLGALWRGTTTMWFSPWTILLYLMPVLLLAPGLPPVTRRWAAQALGFTLVWLLPAPKFGRYLLPAVVPALAAWWSVAGGRRGAGALAALFVLAGSLSFVVQVREVRVPPEHILTGAVAPAAARRAALGPYDDLVAWINREAPGRERVLIVGQGYGWGLARPWLANNECGRPAWFTAAGPVPDEGRMRISLRQANIGWVVYNPVRAFHRHALALGLEVGDAWFAAWAGTWRRWASLARPPDPQDWTGYWYVYRIEPRPHAPVPQAWLPGAERLLQEEARLMAGKADRVQLARLNRIMGDFGGALRQTALAKGIQSKHP